MAKGKCKYREVWKCKISDVNDGVYRDCIGEDTCDDYEEAEAPDART